MVEKACRRTIVRPVIILAKDLAPSPLRGLCFWPIPIDFFIILMYRTIGCMESINQLGTTATSTVVNC